MEGTQGGLPIFEPAPGGLGGDPSGSATDPWRFACQPGECLLIEDTSGTGLFVSSATEGLGSIGNGRGRGMLLHSCLAVQVGYWDAAQRPVGTVVGFLGQKCWRRHGPPKRGAGGKRGGSGCQSAAGVAAVGGGFGTGWEGHRRGVSWIYVADREADFYEPIERWQRQRERFCLAGLSGSGTLFSERRSSLGAVRAGSGVGTIAAHRVAGSAWASGSAGAGGGAGDGRASSRGREQQWGCFDRKLNLNVVEVSEAGAAARGRAAPLVVAEFLAVWATWSPSANGWWQCYRGALAG